MQKHVSRKVAGMLGLTLLIGFGAALAETASITPPPVVLGDDIELHPRWEKQYSTFGELARDSVTVARGTIVSTGDTFVLSSDPVDPLRTLFMTTYTLQIEEVLWGESLPPTVSLVQLGGEHLGLKARVFDQLQYENGETLVLFLTEYDFHAAPEGAYITVGGPQGELRVDGDELYSTDHYLPGPAGWISVRAEGTHIAHLTTQLREEFG